MEDFIKRTVEHVRVCSELAEAKKRLAVAEELLSECLMLMKLIAALNHRPVKGGPLRDAIEAFLATATSPDHVLVLIEDLMLLIAQDEDELFVSARNRIKAALNRKEKP